MPRNFIITGLDIGTSFIKGLTVLKKPNVSELEVLAQAKTPAAGMRRGVVMNPEEVSKKVIQVIEQLQEQSGQKIKEVFLNIGGSHISSLSSRGEIIVSRADQKISQEDINRVIQASQALSLASNREIVEVFPREFIVDNEKGIKDVLGMKGLRLGAEILLVCVFSPYLKNVTQAVLDSDLQILDIIPSPLASARAVLNPQQKELGTILVDFGAGSTGIAVYEEGDLIHTAVFPIGSSHITSDVAVGLKCEIETAERIKKEFGSCLVKGKQKIEKIELVGETAPLTFSHKILGEIIEARVSEIFELIQKELKKISRQGLLPAGVILTGGGANLPKIVDFTKKELKLPCKIGFPKNTKDPSLSTIWGLVLGGADLITQSPPSKSIFNKLKKIFRVFVP